MARSAKSTGPRFVKYFGPLMQALKDLGGSARPEEAKEAIAQALALPEDVTTKRNKSGLLQYGNDVDWARFYLANAGYIDSSARGVWTLTEAGNTYNLSNGQAIDLFKKVHAHFVEARKAKGPRRPTEAEEGEEDEEEVALAAETTHRDATLKILRELPPPGFERLCQRILREAGFGSVTVTGRSGDGGLDGMGILQVNPLVSFKVLFQCKRYAGAIAPSQVRDFRGAMQGRADKGIILTTGTFTSDARAEAIREGVPPIELVDGEKLLDMLEEMHLGLRPKRAFDVDEAFFAGFR